MVVDHCYRLETSFQFSEQPAVHLGSGPLNILRLARFLGHTLFPLSRGTLWPGDHFCGRTPLLVLNSQFSGHPAARFCPRTLVLHPSRFIFGMDPIFIIWKVV